MRGIEITRNMSDQRKSDILSFIFICGLINLVVVSSLTPTHISGSLLEENKESHKCCWEKHQTRNDIAVPQINEQLLTSSAYRRYSNINVSPSCCKEKRYLGSGDSKPSRTIAVMDNKNNNNIDQLSKSSFKLNSSEAKYKGTDECFKVNLFKNNSDICVNCSSNYINDVTARIPFHNKSILYSFNQEGDKLYSKGNLTADEKCISHHLNSKAKRPKKSDFGEHVCTDRITTASTPMITQAFTLSDSIIQNYQPVNNPLNFNYQSNPPVIYPSTILVANVNEEPELRISMDEKYQHYIHSFLNHDTRRQESQNNIHNFHRLSIQTVNWFSSENIKLPLDSYQDNIRWLLSHSTSNPWVHFHGDIQEITTEETVIYSKCNKCHRLFFPDRDINLAASWNNGKPYINPSVMSNLIYPHLGGPKIGATICNTIKPTDAFHSRRTTCGKKATRPYDTELPNMTLTTCSCNTTTTARTTTTTTITTLTTPTTSSTPPTTEPTTRTTPTFPGPSTPQTTCWTATTPPTTCWTITTSPTTCWTVTTSPTTCWTVTTPPPTKPTSRSTPPSPDSSTPPTSRWTVTTPPPTKPSTSGLTPPPTKSTTSGLTPPPTKLTSKTTPPFPSSSTPPTSCWTVTTSATSCWTVTTPPCTSRTGSSQSVTCWTIKTPKITSHICH